MISRRNFVGGATLAGVFAPIFGIKGKDRNHDILEHGHPYRGYMVRWTGWKSEYNQDVLVGQWCAFPFKDPDRWRETEDGSRPWLFSSVQGGCGAFDKFYVFDVSIKPGQRPIHPWSSEKERKREMDRGALKLKAMIDYVMDNKIDKVSVWELNKELRDIGFQAPERGW